MTFKPYPSVTRVPVGPWKIEAQAMPAPANYVRFSLNVDGMEILRLISQPTLTDCMDAISMAFRKRLIDQEVFNHQVDRYNVFNATHPQATKPEPRKDRPFVRKTPVRVRPRVFPREEAAADD